jgi:hypothetical protein
MKPITNAYTDFRLVNLDPASSQRGPFAVTQRGYDPDDTQMLELVFILKRDGTWLPETVFGTTTHEERFQTVF